MKEILKIDSLHQPPKGTHIQTESGYDQSFSQNNLGGDTELSGTQYASFQSNSVVPMDLLKITKAVLDKNYLDGCYENEVTLACGSEPQKE